MPTSVSVSWYQLYFTPGFGRLCLVSGRSGLSRSSPFTFRYDDLISRMQRGGSVGGGFLARTKASMGAKFAMRPKRKFGPKKTASTRITAAARGTASSTFLINRSVRLVPTRTVRTTFNSNIIAGPVVDLLTAARFDPSGANASCTVFGSTAASQAMYDWSEFQTMFDEYKVNSITLTFRYTSPGITPFLPGVVLRVVKNEDTSIPIQGPTTVVPFGLRDDVLVHSFTPDAPMVKYSFVPMMVAQQMGVPSSAVGPTAFGAALRPIKSTWVDVDTPTAYMGAIAWFNYINTGIQVAVDVTYDVSFRNFQ